MVFQAVSAAARTPAKSKPGCSAARLACALARLTNEMPTLACTTALELVSKFNQPPVLTPLVLVAPVDTVEPFHVPTLLGARSKSIRKKIWYVLELPQKP